MNTSSDPLNPHKTTSLALSELSEPETLLVEHIKRIPGIRYNELQRLTGFANGILSYRLKTLEKANVIAVERQTGTTRFYPDNFSERDTWIIKYLRSKPERQILIILLKHDSLTFAELVDATGKAPSTVSAHVKRLKDGGLISVRYGYPNVYAISRKEVVVELFSRFRESFVEVIVDNFTGIIDEL